MTALDTAGRHLDAAKDALARFHAAALELSRLTAGGDGFGGKSWGILAADAHAMFSEDPDGVWRQVRSDVNRIQRIARQEEAKRPDWERTPEGRARADAMDAENDARRAAVFWAGYGGNADPDAPTPDEMAEERRYLSLSHFVPDVP